MRMADCITKNILDKNYTLGIAKEFEKEGSSEKDFLIITNNSKIEKEFSNIILVDGDFKDVLKKTRDMVHIGYKMISYPLAASIRMMYSPTRSILISANPQEVDEISMEIIDDSIQKYDITMGQRNVDVRNRKDYEIIDYDLIISAIKENGFMKCINKI